MQRDADDAYAVVMGSDEEEAAYGGDGVDRTPSASGPGGRTARRAAQREAKGARSGAGRGAKGAGRGAGAAGGGAKGNKRGRTTGIDDATVAFRRRRMSQIMSSGEIGPAEVAKLRKRIEAASTRVGGRDCAWLFNRYDRDKDGVLNLSELQMCLRKVVSAMCVCVLLNGKAMYVVECQGGVRCMAGRYLRVSMGMRVEMRCLGGQLNARVLWISL